MVIDIEGVHLNSVLKGLGEKVQQSDPYIRQARVGQFDPKTVRMVLELKRAISPHVFTLKPVAEFHNRLVVDLYPQEGEVTAQDDPLLALLEDYNRGDVAKNLPPETPKDGQAGRSRPLVIMLDPGHGGEDPGLSANIKPVKKTWCYRLAASYKN